MKNIKLSYTQEKDLSEIANALNQQRMWLNNFIDGVDDPAKKSRLHEASDALKLTIKRIYDCL